ncbi:MAG: thiamine-phosphate kinase [Candidatus Hydrogenedentota bacterium]
MTTLQNIGEFGFIERMAKFLPRSADVVEGIGDDCAVLKAGKETLLVTVDLSIEDVHFRREKSSPEDIGWKAVAVSLSDIAAMGGYPKFVLASIAAQPDTEVAYLEALYQGMADAAAFGGAVIVGGDTSRSNQGIVIDTISIGTAHEGRYVLRSGAKPGDVLAVSGYPGRSAAGLHAQEHGIDAPELLRVHQRPAARLKEGQWLSTFPGVHAMIDVSDGIIQDADHIGERSGTGIEIDPTYTPDDPLLTAFCAKHGLDARNLALTGGEDYELAIAIAPERMGDLMTAWHVMFATPLAAIGKVREKSGSHETRGGGHDHFVA